MPFGLSVLAWPLVLAEPEDPLLTADDPTPVVPAAGAPDVPELAADPEAPALPPLVPPPAAPPPLAPPPAPCANDAVAPATIAMAANRLSDERVIGQSPLPSSSNPLAGRPFREPGQRSTMEKAETPRLRKSIAFDEDECDKLKSSWRATAWRLRASSKRTGPTEADTTAQPIFFKPLT